MKTLDDAGKVKYISVPGKHLGISKNDTQKYVIPYLLDEALQKQKIKRLSYARVHRSDPEEALNDESSSNFFFEDASYSWPVEVTSFFEEIIGSPGESSTN